MRTRGHFIEIEVITFYKKFDSQYPLYPQLLMKSSQAFAIFAPAGLS